MQGLFQSRPFSFPAINPGVSPGAVQKKSAIQCRPGVDAFQVDLRPKSGGWPLPRDVQAKMEAALGANFSDVRVHVGRPPRNRGMRYPPDPPPVEEMIAVTRAGGRRLA